MENQIVEPFLWILGCGGLFLLIVYSLSKWLQPPRSTSKLATQLYQGGETIEPRERRYLESTIQYVAYFSILDIIGFFLGTLFVRSVMGASLITAASVSMFAILLLSVLVLVRSRVSLRDHVHEVVLAYSKRRQRPASTSEKV